MFWLFVLSIFFFLFLQCLKLTRAHKILALVPEKNACSDDDSTSEDEIDIHPPSPSYESSDPPSINSSLENLNISNSDSDSTILPVHLVEDEGATRITPTLKEVFPSPSTSNYNAIPTLNSIQSLATPTSSHDQSPAPSSTPHVTRSKRKKTFSTPLPTKRVKKEKFKLSYEWTKAALKHRAFLEEGYHKLNKTDKETILEYFYSFFSHEIFADIVLHTNLYSVQQKGKSIQLTDQELKTFLSIEIYMGMIRATSYTDYWATRSRVSQIADLMSLKRYQEIRRFLHFTDNSEESSDRYCKIRPVMEKIRQNCLKLEEEGEYSIDEMMIPYKGRKAGKRKQYIKSKPKKWGFKNFVRAGVSGIIYDFLIYGGEDTFLGYSFKRKEVSLGLGALVVIALCKSIQKRPSTVYADNFFMCPELVYWLREEYGIFCLGTIRNCRLRGCQELLPTDKIVKKKPRGYSAQVVCNKNKLAVVKWHDNKVVTMISSFVDSYPMEKIKRYSKTDKKRVDVDCPQLVKLYNKHMGGVDLADIIISLMANILISHTIQNTKMVYGHICPAYRHLHKQCVATLSKR